MKVPKKKKKIVLKQMLDMIEKYMLHQEYKEMTKFKHGHINSNNVGNICCEVMNQLGGEFAVDASDKSDAKFAVKGTVCPWGIKQAKLNPILCRLTKGIISKVVSNVYDNARVETLKTMGHGDDCCYFEVYTSS
jgi:predicted hydrocarbon binding protein